MHLIERYFSDREHVPLTKEDAPIEVMEKAISEKLEKGGGKVQKHLRIGFYFSKISFNNGYSRRLKEIFERRMINASRWACR